MQIKILNQLEKLKKIDLKEIYQTQKKNIAPVVLILSLSLIYFFSLNARHRIKEEALYWERQSLLVKSLLSEANSEEEILVLLQKRYSQLSRMVLQPGQDKNILQLVKDYAQRMNIRIVNIKAYPAQALKQENNSAVVINSRVVQSLLVCAQADSGYMNLVKYIAALQRVSPALVTVERLRIIRDKRNPDKLKVVLELRFYSLSWGIGKYKTSPTAKIAVSHRRRRFS